MGARYSLGSGLPVLGLLLAACAGGTPAAGGAAPAPGASATRASAAAAPSPAAAAPTTAPRAMMTIKVATTPSISNGARYIALERGYFREEGIELEEVPSDTSAQTLPALAAGQVEIVGGGISAALFNAILQGIPVRLVLDQWTASPGNGAGGLIARKDLVDSGQVRDLADLRGLKVRDLGAWAGYRVRPGRRAGAGGAGADGRRNDPDVLPGHDRGAGQPQH